jgi:hypothetical protein
MITLQGLVKLNTHWFKEHRTGGVEIFQPNRLPTSAEVLRRLKIRRFASENISKYDSHRKTCTATFTPEELVYSRCTTNERASSPSTTHTLLRLTAGYSYIP